MSHNESIIHLMLRISVYGVLNTSCYQYQYHYQRVTSISFLGMFLIVLILGISLDYNKDSIRESISSYDIICYKMLCLLFMFILSENVIILSNFWSTISALYSSSTTTYNQTVQDHITQVTNELTSTNTVLLSNCSLSLGSIFQINDTHLLGYHIVTIASSVLISHAFISCQTKEYQHVSLLMNESLTTSEFFILIGIHFCHIIAGNILITLYL